MSIHVQAYTDVVTVLAVGRDFRKVCIIVQLAVDLLLPDVRKCSKFIKEQQKRMLIKIPKKGYLHAPIADGS